MVSGLIGKLIVVLNDFGSEVIGVVDCVLVDVVDDLGNWILKVYVGSEVILFFNI